jgi:hypothetical protein
MTVAEAVRAKPRADGRLFGDGAERTLDDVLTDVLYDVSRGDPVPCPVCGVPALSLDREDLLACGSCGSRLESS